LVLLDYADWSGDLNNEVQQLVWKN